MKIEEISCTNCGAPLKETDIAPELRVARCSHCQSIFSLKPEITVEPEKSGETDDEPLIALPDEFKVLESADQLEISWRWFRGHHVFLFFFSIPWTAFAIFWISLASQASGLFALFGLPFVAIGVGMFYSSLCGFLNRTTLSVTPERLRIYHAPLIWPMPPIIHPSHLKQFYCRQIVHKNKDGTGYSYSLHVALHNGRHVKLLSLDDYAQAHTLERKIERYLNIEDRHVDGEHRE